MLVEFEGHTPQVAADAYVAPGAHLIGSVTVGSEASVWFGATARADGNTITIGARSNLQDGAVMHADPGFPATLGDDVSVGHAAVVHGCTIGDRVLVGMSATVMNGAKVGSDTIIAAGALVSEGAEIPPRSLVVGVPGKVRRELTDEEVAAVADNAARYVDRRREFIETARVVRD